MKQNVTLIALASAAMLAVSGCSGSGDEPAPNGSASEQNVTDNGSGADAGSSADNAAGNTDASGGGAADGGAGGGGAAEGGAEGGSASAAPEVPATPFQGELKCQLDGDSFSLVGPMTNTTDKPVEFTVTAVVTTGEAQEPVAQKAVTQRVEPGAQGTFEALKFHKKEGEQQCVINVEAAPVP